MKRFISVAIITFLIGCNGKEAQKTALQGKPLPNFTLLLADSLHSVSSANMPSGKPIVIFYLSPFCPYCKAQTKDIIEHIDKLKDIQFYFVTTSSFKLKDFKEYCSQYQLSKYSNIIAGVDTASTIANYFEISNVPYLAVYKKDKTLNKTFLGQIYTKQLIESTEE